MLLGNLHSCNTKTKSDTLITWFKTNLQSGGKKSSFPNGITGMFYILFPEGMRASTLLLCQHTRVAAVRAACVHIYRRLQSVRAAGRVEILVWRSHNPQDALCSSSCPSPNIHHLICVLKHECCYKSQKFQNWQLCVTVAAGCFFNRITESHR